MMTKTQKYPRSLGLVIPVLVVMLLITTGSTTEANAQTAGDVAVNAKNIETGQIKSETSPAPTLPLLKHYKEINIGTTADEVRDKLGKAKIDDKDGFYYEFSDDEFAQIRLGSDGKVRLISITYLTGKNAPAYAEILGGDPKTAAKADGSVYTLVRYPKAGYWVAYSRGAGEEAPVTITMQKL